MFRLVASNKINWLLPDDPVHYKLLLVDTLHFCPIMYMVRNHQNGYSYLNLSLFCLFKFPDLIFLVKLICQWILDGEGQGIAMDILKNHFHFQKSAKFLIKLGHFKRWNVEKGPGKLVTFLLKISRHLNYFGRMDWLMNSGEQRAGDS